MTKGKTMSGWRLIESAPRCNRPVLLWFPNGMAGDHIAMARWQKHGWSFKNHAAWGSAVRDLPTHWMPLPSPPPAIADTSHGKENPGGPHD